MINANPMPESQHALPNALHFLCMIPPYYLTILMVMILVYVSPKTRTIRTLQDACSAQPVAVKQLTPVAVPEASSGRTNDQIGLPRRVHSFQRGVAHADPDRRCLRRAGPVSAPQPATGADVDLVPGSPGGSAHPPGHGRGQEVQRPGHMASSPCRMGAP